MRPTRSAGLSMQHGGSLGWCGLRRCAPHVFSSVRTFDNPVSKRRRRLWPLIASKRSRVQPRRQHSSLSWTGRCATHESGPDRRALALYRPPTFQECPPLARRDTLPLSMPPTASTAAGGSLSGPGTRLGQTGRAQQRAALAGRGPAWSALHQLRRQHATRARQAGMAIMTARRPEECDLTSTSLRFAPTTTRP